MSILLSLQAVGAQTAEQMPDLTAVTAPTEAEINVIDLAFKGGWIMVVLLLLSLMACYIFIQRLMVIRRAGKEDETFMNRIKDYIHEGKVDSALNLCRSTNTPSARMIEKGITRLGRPMNEALFSTPSSIVQFKNNSFKFLFLDKSRAVKSVLDTSRYSSDGYSDTIKDFKE